MSTEAESLIASFHALPGLAQHEVAFAILRATADMDHAPLTDDELAFAADELFVELDRGE